MELRPFEKEVLAATGNASEILAQFYDLKITPSNARKYLAGIRKHLERIQSEEETSQENSLRNLESNEAGEITSTRLLRLSVEDMKNPKRLMELHGFDPLQWVLVNAQQSIWNSPQKEADPLELYSSRLKVRPTQTVLSTETIQKIFNDLQAPKLHIYRNTKGANKMIEFPVMDLHLGKLSWDDETGENWDLQIAEDTFRKVVSDGLDKLNQYDIKAELVVFPIGQDFFHFDTEKGTTAAGTIVDSDTRWQKMFAKGFELNVWAIENLRRIAPVKVMNVFGNHDKMLSYCLVYALNAYFRGCDDVEVDISPTSRKYVHYGKNLIGFSHGSEEGKRIDTIMQVEMPEAWAGSVYREWHLGHLHHEQTREDGGVIVRYLPSVTSTDSWHKLKGFVGSIRKVPIYVWDRDNGKDLTIDINLGLRA